MATLTFPKGKTAILIMDCQNDIVHENGKMAATNNGVMAKLIKERSVLGTIARLAAAGRKTGVPIIHVRHVTAEAYEPVEHGAMTEEDFRDFVLSNPVKLWTALNPDFFKGTVVESAVSRSLANSGTAPRGTKP